MKSPLLLVKALRMSCILSLVFSCFSQPLFSLGSSPYSDSKPFLNVPGLLFDFLPRSNEITSYLDNFPLLQGARKFIRSGAQTTLEEIGNIRSSLSVAGERLTTAAGNTVRSFGTGTQKVERLLQNITSEAKQRIPSIIETPFSSVLNHEKYGANSGNKNNVKISSLTEENPNSMEKKRRSDSIKSNLTSRKLGLLENIERSASFGDSEGALQTKEGEMELEHSPNSTTVNNAEIIRLNNLKTMLTNNDNPYVVHRAVRNGDGSLIIERPPIRELGSHLRTKPHRDFSRKRLHRRIENKYRYKSIPKRVGKHLGAGMKRHSLYSSRGDSTHINVDSNIPSGTPTVNLTSSYHPVPSNFYSHGEASFMSKSSVGTTFVDKSSNAPSDSSLVPELMHPDTIFEDGFFAFNEPSPTMTPNNFYISEIASTYKMF